MRVISYPTALKPAAYTFLSGPLAKSTQSVEHLEQVVEDPRAPWVIEFRFASLRGDLARAYRGFRFAMNAGANAALVPFCDFDRLSHAQLGLTEGATIPNASIAAAASEGDVEIVINTTNWNDALDVGSVFGTLYAMYVVTEITYDGSEATCRVWPTVRRDLTIGAVATMRPFLPMRLSGGDAEFDRGTFSADGASLRMVEVPADVFAGL